MCPWQGPSWSEWYCKGWILTIIRSFQIYGCHEVCMRRCSLFIFVTSWLSSMCMPWSHTFVRRFNAYMEWWSDTCVPDLDRMTNKFLTRGEVTVDMYDDMDSTGPITSKMTSYLVCFGDRQIFLYLQMLWSLYEKMFEDYHHNFTTSQHMSMWGPTISNNSRMNDMAGIYVYLQRIRCCHLDPSWQVGPNIFYTMLHWDE